MYPSPLTYVVEWFVKLHSVLSHLEPATHDDGRRVSSPDVLCLLAMAVLSLRVVNGNQINGVAPQNFAAPNGRPNTFVSVSMRFIRL